MVKKIIETKKIGKAFNNVQVLKDVDFDLKEGEIHALVGENGAGKSTFVKMLTGVYTPTEGTILFEGEPVNISNVADSENLGIRCVYQEINLIPEQTVYENVFLGNEISKSVAGVQVMDDKEMKRITREVLDLMKVDLDVNKPAIYLNTTMKKIVEICRVLIYKPRVIIFDEPTAALDGNMREHLMEVIKNLKDQGISIVYISHHLEEIQQIADRVTVFRNGQKVGLLNSEDISLETIIYLMLGNKQYSQLKRQERYATDEIVLEAKNVSTEYLRDVSFHVKKSEIIGFAGKEGAGKTEIARVIFGLDKLTGGEIILNGHPITLTPVKSVEHNVALVPEERALQGIIPDFSICNNITLPYLNLWAPRGVINSKEEIKSANEYIDKLNIVSQGHTQLVKNLSGGNQQKVVLSKWMAGDFQVGIFDEPTRGIDINAKEEIYHLLDAFAKSGKSLLIMSSYLTELINICDRIYVVCDGHIVEEIVVEEQKYNALEEKIVNCMMVGGKVGAR